MIDPTMPETPAAPAPSLSAAHMRLTIGDALRHTERAIREAEAGQLPQAVYDNLFIALCRLESAKAATKEHASC